jgi:hypothetical protein
MGSIWNSEKSIDQDHKYAISAAADAREEVLCIVLFPHGCPGGKSSKDVLWSNL